MTGESFRQRNLARSTPEWLHRLVVHDGLAGTAYRLADCIAPVGEALEQQLLDAGYNGDKICVRPQPFGGGGFEPVDDREKRALRHRLDIPTDRRIALFVGRLSWLKGADRLREIIEKMERRQAGRYQFCLVGDGRDRDLLEGFSEPMVNLAARVDPEEMPDYYQAADVLVFPSRTEGLPNVVLEALLCHLPVIASPVGENPRLLSRTPGDIRGFCKWLERENLSPDPIPEWAGWEEQRRGWRQLFRRVANCESPRDV
jgi:glycosyltransferase involved in cell wall biosynthesis